MRNLFVRRVFAIITLVACLYLMLTAARGGVSRFLSQYGPTAGLLLAQDGSPPEEQFKLVDTAVSFSPADPDAHHARGVVFYETNRFAEAATEFERSVAAQPRFHFLWVKLGQARAGAGDAEGALAAYREAVRLAPFYSEPRWQLGNLLLRMNETEEAFVELRQAAASAPALLPYTTNLAWGAFGGDAARIVQALRPETPVEQLDLARMFAQRGETRAAMELFRRAGGKASAESRRALLEELLKAKQFVAAREVWSRGRRVSGVAGDIDIPDERSVNEKEGVGVITDPSFEQAIRRDDPGFGWQIPQTARGVGFDLDVGDPRAGNRSLRINWAGNGSPQSPVFSQLVLVEGGTRYRLAFASRAERVRTGGLPIIIVTDATTEGELVRSKPLLPDAASWQNDVIEFNTPPAASAVRISIARENCSSGPCPVFGHTWLDEFSLRKL